LSNRLSNRLDNQLYCVNGVLALSLKQLTDGQVCVRTVNNSQYAPKQEDDKKSNRLLAVAGDALDEDYVQTERRQYDDSIEQL